jgi:nitrate reductase cytochrome c-type subunit
MIGRWAGPAAALLAAALCASAAGAAAAGAPAGAPAEQFPDYQATSTCRICHERIVEQHESSMHARAFSDPVFQAQYFRQVVPAAADDAALAQEANRCVACHSPVTFLKNRARTAPIREFDPSLAGVVCDFCHRVGSYKGGRPGGGNYMSSPGAKKFGPVKHPTSDWHHVYHELQTKSELCGVCHEDRNRGGLAIKTTFSEWEASPYAASGIQCQDCHMNLLGYLAEDQPVFESGKAAAMTVGRSRERPAVYTHRFPGAHESSQMEGAIEVRISVDRESAAAGDEVAVSVEVANRRAGHSIPTGSADLRLAWLEISAAAGAAVTPLAALPARPDAPFDVAGAGPADARVIGDDVPAGSRLYRAVLADGSGAQTLDSATAAAVLFDNRLKAREQRVERYRYRVPAEAREPVVLLARVYYLAYPAAFARLLDVPKAAKVLMAEGRAALPVAPAAGR